MWASRERTLRKRTHERKKERKKVRENKESVSKTDKLWILRDMPRTTVGVQVIPEFIDPTQITYFTCDFIHVRLNLLQSHPLSFHTINSSIINQSHSLSFAKLSNAVAYVYTFSQQIDSVILCKVPPQTFRLYKGSIKVW